MANIINATGSQFFADQQIHAADLNNTQYTSIQLLRNYLKNITKTPGVYLTSFVDSVGIRSGGLAVTCNAGGTLLDIASGIGCDSQGRLIIVPSDPTAVSGSLGADPLYYPSRPARTSISPEVSSAGTYYINIYHDLIYGMQEPDDIGDQHYTRVYDSYRTVVENAPTSIGLTLATGIFNSGGNLDITSDSGGYIASDGIKYALFDNRIGHELYNKKQGDLQTSVDTLNAAVFDEELEQSVGFVFPADGHSVVTKIHRDATILRLELYIELQSGEEGTVTYQLFSGSTASTLKGPWGQLETSTANQVTVGSDLNLMYQKNHPIKFHLLRADDSVTRTTASIVYKRR